MTKRTNEQPTVDLDIRSSAAHRLAAIFLSNNILTLKEIYRILETAPIAPDFSRSSLRGVLTRWKNRNILLFDGRRYILNPRGGRDILLRALGEEIKPVREQGGLDSPSTRPEIRTERVLVEITPRWWNEVFDLPAAWMENTVLYCRIDEYIAKAMWTLCPLKPRGPKDRSQKARYYDTEGTFTLVVFPRGKFHIFTKNNPEWFDRFGKWLAKGGFKPSDLILISKAVRNELGRSVGTLEIPLKRSTDPVQQFDMTIETERQKAHIRLVHSHFEDLGEIEVRGLLQYRLDWLGMLAGASMEVMNRSEEFEELKTERTELKSQLETMQEQLNEIRKKFKKQEETLQEIEKEREIQREEDKKSPDYIA